MRRVVLASALAVAACGLIGEDLTTITVNLPPRDFRIDSADWRLPAGDIPAFPCAGDCTALQEEACSQGNCTAQCGTDQLCELAVPVSLKNDLDLSTDSGFQQLSNLSSVDVTLKSVAFNITENTLTVATPQLQVYFGPPSVTAPTDAGAELVGTIPSILAGQTGVAPVTFSASGAATVKKFMDDYRTPFRILVYSVVVVHSGPTPSGRLVGQVTASATVGLSL